jgi:hypothetical protein
MQHNALKGENNLIHIKHFIRCLSSFRIKLSEKQRDTIVKLYRVNFAGDPNIINVQPFFDVEKNLKRSLMKSSKWILQVTWEISIDIASMEPLSRELL